MSVLRLRSLGFSFRFLSILGVALLALAVPMLPQGTNATLGGVISDPSGAVMPGAEVTLTNQASGFEEKSVTNDRGEYTFRNLVPGTYQLKVSKSGFSSYVQKDIVLTINQAARVDAGLKVGAQTETVSVSADTTLLNYDNATVQGGIDPETLKSLPLTVEGKPRSSAALVVLEPGVTTGSSNQAFQARINGGVESGDEALMDGATMQEGFMSQSGMVSIHQDFQMSPDMVQEVKVIASNYDAQYGGSTSAQVAVVTKSGGNNYHGAAFEYARNTALNAAQWGSPKKTVDVENNFGANFGGPIKIPKIYEGTSKHKSYFYFNWESYHIAGGSSVPTLTIPSLKERTG
ncbi:MAG TPA: carboxypeptidase-like regulatory domain-containing protein, partial [Terriglobales bacterium]|nr:carboxypeptidase-like regulatory domain-containing protein [Terriglobales bacterium]